ncbi:MAG: prepilin-type N-terminal cleavage/methylation domain-containing protein [Moritella sp.]|uniref:pilus assembly FimT family protein n=1 Tax=Moritella sp. TaxID=78556 RepID=UPI001D289923|nr:prepilin-type N-terminal cleavage/methylation domain-containing protein [Moritella sp.]NQZ50243.1 prepilin-type N-terminal cleavage/methylation domain-containing protein [Moritella sp.]
MSKNIYKNTRYSKHKGFTLIELVIVIIVLGILAATAVPKFINLSAGTKAANLESIAGSMRSALQLVHAKAVIKGQDGSTGSIDINGTNIPLINSYPSLNYGGFPAMNRQLKAWLEINSVDRNTARGNRDAAPFFSDRARGTFLFIFLLQIMIKKVQALNAKFATRTQRQWQLRL